LTVLDESRQEVGHGGPRFLPDGRHFIYSRASRVAANTALYVGSIDASGNPTGDAVKADGPAAKAGIKDGDIITKVGDKTIDSEHPLDSVLRQFSPNQTIPVELLRDGKTVTVQVTLGTRPGNL
jgi:S1-C subfamily serine protease